MNGCRAAAGRKRKTVRDEFSRLCINQCDQRGDLNDKQEGDLGGRIRRTRGGGAGEVKDKGGTVEGEGDCTELCTKKVPLIGERPLHGTHRLGMTCRRATRRNASPWTIDAGVQDSVLLA